MLSQWDFSGASTFKHSVCAARKSSWKSIPVSCQLSAGSKILMSKELSPMQIRKLPLHPIWLLVFICLNVLGFFFPLPFPPPVVLCQHILLLGERLRGKGFSLTLSLCPISEIWTLETGWSVFSAAFAWCVTLLLTVWKSTCSCFFHLQCALSQTWVHTVFSHANKVLNLTIQRAYIWISVELT